ncbi:MAG: class I SAM-dependent methyltransferase [Paracoccaceae bacterium]
MINSLRARLAPLLRKLGLFDSGAYWAARYRRGGDSGAGSYGDFAIYKADFLNAFAAEHQVSSVIEFGCGDGAQAEMFAFASYTGVDVTQEAVELCRSKLGDRKNWQFHNLADAASYAGAYDLVLSLDVVYHLVEDPVFDLYMAQLFEHAGQHVLIYSSDHDQVSAAAHVNHRNHSAWVAKNQPNWSVVAVHENPHGGDGPDQSFAFFTHYRRSRR